MQKIHKIYNYQIQIKTQKMKQLTVTAFEHANVAGKKLQYIRISGLTGEHIINVGMKTYEAVKKLEEETNTIQLENLKKDEPNTNTNMPDMDSHRPNGAKGNNKTR